MNTLIVIFSDDKDQSSCLKFRIFRMKRKRKKKPCSEKLSRSYDSEAALTIERDDFVSS